MRLVFNADKDTLEAINKIQGNYQDSSESLGIVVIDAIHFLFQMETLMDSGFKLAIIDPEGKQHLISKRNLKRDEKEEDDNYGTSNED